MPTKRFVPASNRRRRFIRNQHRGYRTSLSKGTFSGKDVLDIQTVKEHQERIKNRITKKIILKNIKILKENLKFSFFYYNYRKFFLIKYWKWGTIYIEVLNKGDKKCMC